MRVMITGATGFVGSHVVGELIGAGHHVIGVSRSAHGTDALRRVGAEPFECDLRRLRVAVDGADAVIHTAFNRDFSKLKQHSEEDRAVIETLGDVLIGSDRPLIVTSGTGLARAKPGEPATEHDEALPSVEFARGATEEAAQ